MYDIDERVLKTADYITEHECTVRAAANHFSVSKSTVHKDMSERLKDLSAIRFAEVERIMRHNKEVRHLRGGEATKNKYLQKKKSVR